AIGSAKQVPPVIEMIAPESGISTLTFNSPSPEGVLSSTPLWKIFVLPAAGAVKVVTQNLGAGAQVKSYALLKLQFGKDFNETLIDGTTAMKSLTRFASSVAKVEGRVQP
ncbi:MAG: hypothetical protein AABZ55_12125, partial [Bdellovibrionota bacterium]